jgi:hypothetical protein
MLDFVFFKVIYPLFASQIDELLDRYRLAQLKSVDIQKSGEVYVSVNKAYSVGTELMIYTAGQHEQDPPYGYLGAVETVYGIAEVIEECSDQSIAIMTRIDKLLAPGLLVKSIDFSVESILKSFKENKWIK